MTLELVLWGPLARDRDRLYILTGAWCTRFRGSHHGDKFSNFFRFSSLWGGANNFNALAFEGCPRSAGGHAWWVAEYSQSTCDSELQLMQHYQYNWVIYMQRNWRDNLLWRRVYVLTSTYKLERILIPGLIFFNRFPNSSELTVVLSLLAHTKILKWPCKRYWLRCWLFTQKQ